MPKAFAYFIQPGNASTIRYYERRIITLKAFANASPGFALKPWVQERLFRLVATLKALRQVCKCRDATLTELRLF